MNYSLSYYSWINQVFTLEETTKAVRQFCDRVEQELSRVSGEATTIVVQPVMDVPQQIDWIVKGKSDFALMNPLGFAFANKIESSVEVIAVIKRQTSAGVGKTYYSQIYVNSISKIKRLEDLRGKNLTLGFGQPFSTSNFLVGAWMLKKHGLNPLTAFQRAQFAGGHDKVAWAVYRNELDVGVGHDGVIDTLAATAGYENASRSLVRLWTSVDEGFPIPSDPVVFQSKDAKVRDMMKQVMINLKDDPTIAAATKIFWSSDKGLDQITAKEYSPLLDMMTELGLKQEDVLR